MRRLTILTGLILAILLFFSCDAKVVVDLKVDNSGKADVAVDLDPMITRYIFDMQSFFTNVSAEEAQKLFDPTKAKEALEKSKTVRVISIDAPDKHKINMKLAFKDLNEVLSEGNELIDSEVQSDIKKILNMSVGKDGVKTVSFNLNKENFESLIVLIPEELQSFVAPFFPSGRDLVNTLADEETDAEVMAEEDMIQVIEEHFSEYDSDYMGQRVKESKFTFKVNFGGQLISYKGGKRKGNSLVVEVPLLDVLILKEPIEFEARFK